MATEWMKNTVCSITIPRFHVSTGEDKILGSLDWEPHKGERRPFLSIGKECELQLPGEDEKERAELWEEIIEAISRDKGGDDEDEKNSSR